MPTVTIEGAERDVRCECCNRPLKVGVRTDRLGTIGADCLRAAMVADRKRFSQGKPDAKFLRHLAICKETKSADWHRRCGYPATLYTFTLAASAPAAQPALI